MKIFLVSASDVVSKMAPSAPLPKIRELVSYFDLRKGAAAERLFARAAWRTELFLDSGAFSAYTRKVPLEIDDYIEFVHRHEDYFGTYANLDVIGDPAATWENQLEMERQGLAPLPCYHHGEDIQWLKKYMTRYEYFAFGGMVPLNGDAQRRWLDAMMPLVCDSEGQPRWKFHGFGTCGSGLLFRYPWFSADSTAWMVGSRWGGLLLWWGNQQITFKIAGGCDERRHVGRHISTLSAVERKRITEIVEAVGYTLEELISNPNKRDEWNIRFVMNYELLLQGDRRFTPEGKHSRGFFE